MGRGVIRGLCLYIWTAIRDSREQDQGHSIIDLVVTCCDQVGYCCSNWRGAIEEPLKGIHVTPDTVYRHRDFHG